MSEDAPLCGPRLLGPEELHECLTAIPLEDVQQRVRDHIDALTYLLRLYRGSPNLPAAAGCHEELPAEANLSPMWSRSPDPDF